MKRNEANMKRNADEGIGQKQGGLNIRLFEGKVKTGNKMQKKTKASCTPRLLPYPVPLPSLSFPPPPCPVLSFSLLTPSPLLSLPLQKT